MSRRRAAAWALVALLVALLPGAALAQQKALVVPAGEVRAGDLATLDQPIVVAGRVEGDVTSWTGAILVSGQVTGDVVSYAGSVELAPGATVGGSVLSLAGALAGEQASVAGTLIGPQPGPGGALVASVATIFGRPPGPQAAELPRPVISATLALAALAACSLVAAVWPRRTRGAARALADAPARAIALGLLTTALAALTLAPVSALLALSLVGLPLLVPLLLLAQLPYLVGLAAVGRAVGEQSGLRGLPAPVAAALGSGAFLLPIAVIGAVAPVLSAALFYIVASAGLGAAIISRGGAVLAQRAPRREAH